MNKYNRIMGHAMRKQQRKNKSEKETENVGMLREVRMVV